MAINNVSGNFQPPPLRSGETLPQQEVGAPSSAVETSETKAQGVGNPVPISDKQSPNGQQNEQDAAVSQIEEFKDFNLSINRSLKFKIDEELGVTIVRVVDKQTDELIRQFPPEELINLSKRLKELNQENPGKSGVFLQEKV